MLTINCSQRNYLSLLLHNFTGFLTLDSILKNAYNSVPYRYKYFAFCGNIVDFEYKYKFTEINLRALRPKQNELYIYIDFGLKSVLQFNSAEFYGNDRFNVQTSERVTALFLKLDRHFNDRSLIVHPYNKLNLDFFFLKNNKTLSSKIVNSKFFVENTFFNNFFFSYKGLIEQLCFHFSVLKFYNFQFNFFLLAFYNKVPIFTNLALNSFIDSFLLNFDHINDISHFGFHWHQSRVNGIYLHKFLFHLKTAPKLLKQKLDLDVDKKKGKTIPIRSKLFFKHIINLFNTNVYRFLFNFFLNKKKKRSYKGRFLWYISKRYLSGKKIKYYMKHKLRHFFLQFIWTFCYVFAKKNRTERYNYGISYLLNFNKPELINEFKIIDTFYLDNVDKGLLLQRKRINYKNKTRITSLAFCLRKRFYLGYKLLKNICISKFNNLVVVKNVSFQPKCKWRLNLKLHNFNKKLSIRSLIKTVSKLFSYKQHSFKNWITCTFQYTLCNYLDFLPKGFFYKGFVKDDMYLYYKQFFAGVSLQLSVLRYVLRYLWLTSYLLRLLNKKSIFKSKKSVLLKDFLFKIKFDKYLISLVNAFSYSVVMRLKIMNFMTNQLSEPIASEEEKKMKIYWRTIKLDFVPALLSKLNFFDQTNFAFISFSLSFLLLYHFFLYQKRFLFSMGSLFWFKVVNLKNVFKWLFIKETKFNLKFYRAYFVYFINFIKNNKYLFLSFFYYTLKYNNNYKLTISSAKIISSLRFFLFDKLNLLTFLFPISLYWINLNFNTFIKTNRTYKNYKFFYKKLFLVTNVKVIRSKSEEKPTNILLKPILFNISHLNSVMNYKQLLSFWDWTNNIKPNNKLLMSSQGFMHVTNILAKSLFFSLSNNSIYKVKSTFNNQNYSMFKIHRKFFSTSVISSPRLLNNKSPFFYRKNLLKIYNKKCGIIINKTLRFYKVFSVFFLKKKCITKLFYTFLFKKKVLNLVTLSKRRLLFLFKNSFNGSFLLNIFVCQVKYLLGTLGFSMAYTLFFCNKVVWWLRSFKIALTMKTIRVFIFAFLYCLQRFPFKPKNNKSVFFNRLKQIFISFFSKVHFMSFLDLPNKKSFFEPFLRNVNFFFFNNSANLFNVFNRQFFKIHNKLREIKHLKLKENINLFTRTKNNDLSVFPFSHDINFKSLSFSFFKRSGAIFKHFGFLFFPKFLHLFFFSFFSKSKTKSFNFLKKFDLINKFSFKNTVYTFKKIRFIIFLLNKLFSKTLKKKSNFWINTLCIFKILFKNNTYKKKTLYKYSFSLYKKHAICNAYFVRKTFSKRVNRFNLALLYQYKIPFWHRSRFQKSIYKKTLYRFLKKKGILYFSTFIKGKKLLKRNKIREIKLYKHKKPRFFVKSKKFNKSVKHIKLKLTRRLYKVKKKSLEILLLNCYGRSFCLRRFLRYSKLKLTSFFVWLFLYKRFSFFKFKNTSSSILWKKGISYHLNKLRFYYYKFYCVVFPLRKKPKITKKFKKYLKRMTMLNLWRIMFPLQVRVTKTYNIDFLIGNFIQRPIIFCLTRIKKRRFTREINKLVYSVQDYFYLWKQRLFILKPGKKIVRTDLVYILRYLLRFNKRRRFYLLNKLYFFIWNYYKGINIYFDTIDALAFRPKFKIKSKKEIYRYFA